MISVIMLYDNISNSVRFFKHVGFPKFLLNYCNSLRLTEHLLQLLPHPDLPPVMLFFCIYTIITTPLPSSAHLNQFGDKFLSHPI